ncbi:MAG: hypothetical protein KF718_20595 [Polyangiaceae bacterium]|nr:hypothetical protein [Polyangiaceae bacterium]
MGIDGIGKPPGGAPLPTAAEAGGAAKTGATFDAGRAEKPEATAEVDSLGRLGRGEITLDQYLDERVASASAPLAASLGPEQLEFVQSALREQLATDPVLIELVRRATGQVPRAE